MKPLESITEARPRMFTREDLKFIFQVGESTIDEWQTEGRLPIFRKGRVVRYPAEGVLAWARKYTVNAAALNGQPPRVEDLELFWRHIERMVSVIVSQTLAELQHPNHLEAA